MFDNAEGCVAQKNLMPNCVSVCVGVFSSDLLFAHNDDRSDEFDTMMRHVAENPFNAFETAGGRARALTTSVKLVA